MGGSTSVPIISLAVMRTAPRSSVTPPEATRCKASAALAIASAKGTSAAAPSVASRPACVRCEQGDAQRLLERVHVTAHRGLGEVERARRTGQAAWRNTAKNER